MTLNRYKKSQPLFFVGYHECPACHEPVFPAEAAELAQHSVRYRWACDICGHRFETEVVLLGSTVAT